MDDKIFRSTGLWKDLATSGTSNPYAGYDYFSGGNPYVQEVMESAITTLKKTASGTTGSLNQHADTGASASAISNNLGYLNSKTRNSYSGMPESVRTSAIK